MSTREHRAPRGAMVLSARWRMLLLLFACRTGLGLQFQALGSVSDPLVAALGLSYTEVGTLIGLFMLPGLFLALPVGYAGRYLRDRSIVVIGLACLAAGGVVAYLAHGFGLLALGRIAAGVGFVLSTVYFTKMTADWFSGRELATAMGVLVMSWPFGVAIGQIGHVWLAEHHDWRLAFAAAGVYCAVAAVAMRIWYRAPDVGAEPAPVPGQPRAVAEEPGLRMPRQELLLTLLAAMVWGLFNAGYVVYLSFAPQVLVAGGYGPTQASAVVSLASWVMIFSGAACGQIADRSGRRDLVLYLCLAAAVVALLLLPVSGMALFSSLLFGLMGMAPAGVIMALTAEAMAPRRRSVGMGLFFSLNFVMMFVSPPLAGWLYDLSGDPFVPVLLAAVLLALAALANRVFRTVKARAPVD